MNSIQDNLIYHGTIGEAGAFISLVIIIFLLALIPANIGKKKGYSFAVFYAFGVFAFLPAIITSLILKKR